MAIYLMKRHHKLQQLFSMPSKIRKMRSKHQETTTNKKILTTEDLNILWSL